MGQTSDPEMLVMHQKMMPGNNPEDFKQQRIGLFLCSINWMLFRRSVQSMKKNAVFLQHVLPSIYA
jgi:hypothetical protein